MEKQTLPVNDNKEALRFERAFDKSEAAFIQYFCYTKFLIPNL